MESVQVLIVEDESLVSQGLVLMLSQAGHTVVGVCSDSVSALEDALDKKPDVILVDAEGPGLDGLDITQRLSEEIPAPIIMLCEQADADYSIKAADAGAYGCLAKPISLETLLPAMATAINRYSEKKAVADELAQLRETLDTRKYSEQAKGIIMQRLQLPEGGAYAHLREKCRNQQKTMKQASIEIIEAERSFLEQLSKDPPGRLRPARSVTERAPVEA